MKELSWTEKRVITARTSRAAGVKYTSVMPNLSWKKDMLIRASSQRMELASIRQQQEQAKETTGIYGKYAEKSRSLSYDEIKAFIDEGKPYVIRLRSSGNHDLPSDEIRHIHVTDAVRGELSMPENDQDVVILKTNGIPTYHMAHVIDDHLMRTTHVVRGEEWLMSLPIHVELFEKLGFEMPVYCHTAQLLKLDNGNKRKLSKRKDPETSLDYYRREGYHPAAVKEYLMTILNSDFEEWRAANPDSSIDEFTFTTEKMSSGGALFDINKLNDISKDVLVKIPAPQLYDFLADWAREFRPEICPLLENRAYVEKILDLGRTGGKPRKDLIYASQIFDFISYFFDDYFVIEDTVPENVSDEDAAEILRRYLDTYDHSDDQTQWFEKIRAIADEMGYAVKPKDYKKFRHVQGPCGSCKHCHKDSAHGKEPVSRYMGNTADPRRTENKRSPFNHDKISACKKFSHKPSNMDKVCGIF